MASRLSFLFIKMYGLDILAVPVHQHGPLKLPGSTLTLWKKQARHG
jgi:hypothetical protein